MSRWRGPAAQVALRAGEAGGGVRPAPSQCRDRHTRNDDADAFAGAGTRSPCLELLNSSRSSSAPAHSAPEPPPTLWARLPRRIRAHDTSGAGG